MRQIETSRTIVFEAPRHARVFFEALVVDNLDIGRPDRIEMIFAGHPRRWGRPPKAEPTYKTRIATRDTVDVTVGLNALGFTNRSLRAQVSHLLGVAYTVNQASYDLARLRLNELIERRPGRTERVRTVDSAAGIIPRISASCIPSRGW